MYMTKSVETLPTSMQQKVLNASQIKIICIQFEMPSKGKQWIFKCVPQHIDFQSNEGTDLLALILLLCRIQDGSLVF